MATATVWRTRRTVAVSRVRAPLRLGPVARAVLTFALLGLVVLALVGIAGTLVLRRLATDQALTQAEEFASFSARVVERRLTDRLLTGDPVASAAVASVVFDSVLHDPVVRVKIWTADGTTSTRTRAG